MTLSSWRGITLPPRRRFVSWSHFCTAWRAGVALCREVSGVECRRSSREKQVGQLGIGKPFVSRSEVGDNRARDASSLFASSGVRAIVSCRDIVPAEQATLIRDKSTVDTFFSLISLAREAISLACEAVHIAGAICKRDRPAAVPNGIGKRIVKVGSSRRIVRVDENRARVARAVSHSNQNGIIALVTVAGGDNKPWGKAEFETT
jgi:hypothetical protein